MKAYINNIPMSSGEVTVLMHQNAEIISHHACQTAVAIRQHAGVLLLNCATSSQRFGKIADKHITDTMRNKSPHLYTRTVYHGNLADEKRYIDDMIDIGNISALIINGWEWGTLNYRKKVKMLEYLRVWAEAKNIAIIIYSQARTEPTIGECDRGGLGWLASIAFSIQRIEGVEDTRNIPKPPPILLDEVVCAEADEFAKVITDELMSYDPKWREMKELLDEVEVRD